MFLKILVILVFLIIIGKWWSNTPYILSSWYQGTTIEFQPPCHSSLDAVGGLCYPKCRGATSTCPALTASGAICSAPVDIGCQTPRTDNYVFYACDSPNQGAGWDAPNTWNLQCYRNCPFGFELGWKDTATGRCVSCNLKGACASTIRIPQVICPIIGDQAGTPISNVSCRYPSNAVKNEDQMAKVLTDPTIPSEIKDDFLQGFCFAKGADGTYPNMYSGHCHTSLCLYRGSHDGDELKAPCDAVNWKNYYCSGDRVLDSTNQVCGNWCEDSTTYGGKSVCTMRRAQVCTDKYNALQKALVVANALVVA